MRRRSVLTGLGGALATGLVPGRIASACQVFPPDGATAFLALRHGRTVGRHAIRFARANGRFIVRTDIAVEVGPPGAARIRLTHHAEEIWVDGWLHAVVSDTDDNGRRFRLRAERRGGIFGGTINGAAFTVSGYIIPSSLWHHDTIASEALFDTIDARVKLVRAWALGREAVPVAGRSVRAEHYALRGEIARDLWYDGACNLVRVAQVLRDGSQLTFEPR